MPDEWSPNAPNAGQHFENVKDPIPPPQPQLPPPAQMQQTGIVTSGELQMREEERQTPVLETHLTVGGETEQTVHQQSFDENEARIDYLQSRLRQAKDRLEKNIDRSR